MASSRHIGGTSLIRQRDAKTDKQISKPRQPRTSRKQAAEAHKTLEHLTNMSNKASPAYGNLYNYFAM